MPSVTAISSDVRPSSGSPCMTRPDPSIEPKSATFLAAFPPAFGSRMRVYEIVQEYVRMFVRIRPLARLLLRTHVPPEHSIPAHAPSAHRALPGPFVPAARGRLRRRLGGRPGRHRPGPIEDRPARERAPVDHPHRTALRGRSARVRAGQPAQAPQTCLCPIEHSSTATARHTVSIRTGRPQAARK
jgi:hypothetical protein